MTHPTVQCTLYSMTEHPIKKKFKVKAVTNNCDIQQTGTVVLLKGGGDKELIIRNVWIYKQRINWKCLI